jgi:recombination protein RecA
MSEDIGYQDRGASKKNESQFVRKYGESIVRNEVTAFLLAQIQANPTGYGAPTQIKVGNTIRHQADVILNGKSVDKWAPTSGEKILGHDMVYYVEESALGSPYVEMKVPLRYGYGIDKPKDVIQHASNLDVIKLGGAWYTLPYIEVEEDKKKSYKLVILEDPEDKKKEDYIVRDIATNKIIKDPKIVKFQGEGNVWQWLMLNPKHLEEIEKLVREKLF